jgi:hypothetical protein
MSNENFDVNGEESWYRRPHGKIYIIDIEI